MHRGLITILAIAGIMTPKPLASKGWLHFSTPSAIAEPEADNSQQDIRLLISMIWDGSSVTAVDLPTIRGFREKFTTIPVAHFISPAYFSQSNPDAVKNKSALFTLSRPGDFVGVNFAPWRSITNKAGVIFRNSPTFWGNIVTDTLCAADCGHDVPLSIYPLDEAKKIMAASIDTLNTAGITNIRGMMVRGWMATPEILQAGASLGMKYDFSAVTPSIIHENLRTFPIFAWVKNLWPKADILSQPGIVSENLPEMISVPQAFSTLDYVTHKQMIEFLDRMLAIKNSEPRTYHIVMHAETAHQTMGKLELVLQELFKQASEGRFRLTMMDLPGMNWVSANSTPMVDATPASENSIRTH